MELMQGTKGWFTLKSSVMVVCYRFDDMSGFDKESPDYQYHTLVDLVQGKIDLVMDEGKTTGFSVKRVGKSQKDGSPIWLGGLVNNGSLFVETSNVKAVQPS